MGASQIYKNNQIKKEVKNSLQNRRATLGLSSWSGFFVCKKILFYCTNVLYNTQKDGIISM